MEKIAKINYVIFILYLSVCLSICLCICYYAVSLCRSHFDHISVEYWANFLLLWIAFGPRNFILDQMMVMMVALNFYWDMNRLYNGLGMEVGVMLHRNVYTDSDQRKMEKHIM